jgi:hypothetical protein
MREPGRAGHDASRPRGGPCYHARVQESLEECHSSRLNHRGSLAVRSRSVGHGILATLSIPAFAGVGSSPGDARFAGIRTFFLLRLLGGIVGIVSGASHAAVAAVLVGKERRLGDATDDRYPNARGCRVFGHAMSHATVARRMARTCDGDDGDAQSRRTHTGVRECPGVERQRGTGQGHSVSVQIPTSVR